MKHSLFSGIGLVVGNMIGVGVLISTGFMAQDLSADAILVAWCLGATVAMCGVLAYSELASAISESGGEYRFLSDSFHPFVGCLAGFGSLFLGFSAAIAVDAFAIGSFLNTIVDGPEARVSGVVVIVAMALMHGVSHKASHHGQNLLVTLKISVVLAFVVLGLTMGSHEWPTSLPAKTPEGGTWSSILANQIWIAFAYSGWNAAVYVAGEFQNPKREVPRAMMSGMIVVGILYIGINWVFLANLSPESSAAVFRYEETRVTLVHLVADTLWGGVAGTVVSIFVMWMLTSSVSSMMVIGPRVYAAMARDGYLPSAFGERLGRPPTGAVLLQAAVALLFLLNQSLRDTVLAAGGSLLLFSALTALGLFVQRAKRARVEGESRRSLTAAIAAVLYASSVAYILYASFRTSERMWQSLALVLVGTLISFSWVKVSAKR